MTKHKQQKKKEENKVATHEIMPGANLDAHRPALMLFADCLSYQLSWPINTHTVPLLHLLPATLLSEGHQRPLSCHTGSRPAF